MKRSISIVLALAVGGALMLAVPFSGFSSKETEGGAYTPGTYEGVGQGFGGDVVVSITTDGSSITAVTVTGDSETPEIGGAHLEELAQQILDAQSADIDGVSGATLTSGGAKNGAAAAIAAAKGGAAGSYTPGTYEGAGQGFGGDVVVSITTDESSITAVTVTGDSETPEIGGAHLEELAQQILDAQSADIDGVSGATLTSGGAKEGAAAAIAAAKGEAAAPAEDTTPSAAPVESVEPSEEPVESETPSEEPTESEAPSEEPAESEAPSAEPVESEAPSEEPAAPAGIYNPGTYTGTGKGFGGDVVVTITTDDNNITAVTVTGDSETPGIGGAHLEELAQQIMSAQSAGIDGVSGATLTSGGAKDGAAAAISAAKR